MAIKNARQPLKCRPKHVIRLFFKVVGAKSLEDFVWKLKRPRRIMLMVKAGQAVDDFINKLVPIITNGDIIIDGGNSEHQVSITVEANFL